MARPKPGLLVRVAPATRPALIALVSFGILSGISALTIALGMAWLVTAVASGTPITAPATLVVGALLARGLLTAGGEYAAHRAGLACATAVRGVVLRRWLGLPVESRPEPSEATTLIGDGVAAIEPYVARYLPALATSVIVPALTLLVLAVVDIWSALIVLLTLPLLPVFAALIGMHTRDQTRSRMTALTRMAGHFVDVVQGLPTLVAYGRADHQVTVVAEVGDQHRRATVRTLRTAFMSTAALELLATISVALVAVSVGLRLAYGTIDLQVGLTAILLAPEAYWPIRRVGAEFHNAAAGAETLQDLSADLDGPTERPTDWPAARPNDGRARDQTVPPSASTIAACRITYGYPGADPALSDVTYTTQNAPGLTVLTGPSGGGKSTLLELLAGLRTPSTGSVSCPPTHLATQRPLLISGTVLDNLALGAPAVTQKAATEALIAVGLWGAVNPRGGLDAVVGDDGFGLSAGQRARLALARAFLSDAPVLLLDEPTAHIAEDSVGDIRQLLTAQATQRPVIVATHDSELVAVADEHWRASLASTPPVPPPAPVGSTAPSEPAPTTPPAPVESTAPPGPGRAPSETRASPDTQPVATVTAERASNLEDGGERVAGGGRVARGERVAGGQRVAGGEPAIWSLIGQTDRLRLACLLGGLSVASGVALTATSGWLIVQASFQPVVLTLLVAIVGVRTFGLARPLLRYAERVVSHDVALADLSRRRADLFARLVPLTPARLGRRSRADFLTALVRDLDDVVDRQVRVQVPWVGTVIASVVAVGVLAWALPMAAAVVAAGAVAALAVGEVTSRLEQARQDVAVQERGRVLAAATTLTAQIGAIQAVGGWVHSSIDAPAAGGGTRSDGQLDGAGTAAPYPRVLANLAAREAAYARAETRLIQVRCVGIGASWAVIAVVTAFVGWLAATGFAGATLSAPWAALVALTPMALAESWTALPDVGGAKARARSAQARLDEVLNQLPAVSLESDTTLTDAATPVELHNISASWSAMPRPRHSSAPGVNGPQNDPGADRQPGTLDLAALTLPLLHTGDRVQLTGPNGAGKSTALAVLARDLDPVQGSYRVAGHDTCRLSVDSVRARIAVIDDEPHAFAGTVRANLALANPGAGDESIRAALHTVDLTRWLDALPAGLDSLLSGLSGGERARLSMARAVLSRRPIVLMDEPAAHLDDATATLAVSGVCRSVPLDGAGPHREQVRAGPTVIAVNHRPQAWTGFQTFDITQSDPGDDAGAAHDMDSAPMSP
ncbi:MAG: thiol reductant ABC exporter subunit CydD [Ornithinimicrobium sp.]